MKELKEKRDYLRILRLSNTPKWYETLEYFFKLSFNRFQNIKMYRYSTLSGIESTPQYCRSRQGSWYLGVIEAEHNGYNA